MDATVRCTDDSAQYRNWRIVVGEHFGEISNFSRNVGEKYRGKRKFDAKVTRLLIFALMQRNFEPQMKMKIDGNIEMKFRLNIEVKFDLKIGVKFSPKVAMQ